MIHARVVFVCSTAEEASLHIGKAIMSKGKFVQVHGDFPYTVYQYKDCLLIWEDQPLAADPIVDWEEHFNCDSYVILYRHSGRGGKKRLTVHPQGNFSSEPKSGKGKSIAKVHAQIMRKMLLCLEEVCSDDRVEYMVNYECTHHGPTSLATPVMFMEAGDDQSVWEDPIAHILMSQAVHKFVEDGEVLEGKSVIGFGGEHYCERFHRRVVSEGWAFGHMVPEREFEDLDGQLLRDCIEKTVPRPEAVIVDKRKKGTAEQRRMDV